MARAVQRDDLLSFRFLSRPAVSPDGGTIAFLVHRADKESNRYESNIWTCRLSDGVLRQMTFSGREKFFCWSPDGSSLVFASERTDDEGTVFYRLSLEGGEAQRLFSLPQKAGAVWELPDGRFLVWARWVPSIENPDEANYQIFDQLPFLANGQGYIGSERTGLGVYAPQSGTWKRLTDETFDLASCTMKDDFSQVLAVGCSFTDVKPQTNSVCLFDLADGTSRDLTEGLAMSFSSAGWHGDDVIATGCDRADRGVHKNPTFFKLADSALTPLSPTLDTGLHSTVGSDCRYGQADQTGEFFDDGLGLVYCSTEGFRSFLFRLNADGSSSRLTDLSSVDSFCVRSGVTAFVGMEPNGLQELYVLNGSGVRRLSHFNDAILSELQVQPAHYVSVQSGDVTLDGWYIEPLNCQPGKKYPTILNIHGGPRGVYGDVFFHEMQCWAAQGYGVIFTNPRGSDGRGNDFDDIRGAYGVTDYGDLMAFAEWCAAHLPFVDSDRLGVAGGSYGGFMVNWMVTHTDRFKAACAQRPISNWVSKFGSCDIGYYYVEDQHVGLPWDGRPGPWDDSPLKYAANAKTPLLLIQSSDDFRCEASQSFQMFTAMKVLGVPCRMCFFHGENHELSRSGKPRNRLARLREISRWFDEML